ncbi:hypothetical protein ACTHQF_06590 [Pedobacter sp. SAFR-022]|uniref:hypothetical protein n=1 Tax=Pedobacter sp. SAFR-022 TaxID=3436861 RepID=UPI003F8159DE
MNEIQNKGSVSQRKEMAEFEEYFLNLPFEEQKQEMIKHLRSLLDFLSDADDEDVILFIVKVQTESIEPLLSHFKKYLNQNGAWIFVLKAGLTEEFNSRITQAIWMNIAYPQENEELLNDIIAIIDDIEDKAIKAHCNEQSKIVRNTPYVRDLIHTVNEAKYILKANVIDAMEIKRGWALKLHDFFITTLDYLKTKDQFPITKKLNKSSVSVEPTNLFKTGIDPQPYLDVLKKVKPPILNAEGEFVRGPKSKACIAAWIDQLSSLGVINEVLNDAQRAELVNKAIPNLDITDRTLRSAESKISRAYLQYEKGIHTLLCKVN